MVFKGISWAFSTHVFAVLIHAGPEITEADVLLHAVVIKVAANRVGIECNEHDVLQGSRI